MYQEMKESGASSMECAAQRVNSVTPIKLQPAQMQTGYTHWMGELLEKYIKNKRSIKATVK